MGRSHEITLTQSVGRVFRVLEAVKELEAPSNIDISRWVGLPDSVTWRLLGDLVALGYVRRDEDKKYFITDKFKEFYVDCGHIRGMND